jgi:hypothetical protein
MSKQAAEHHHKAAEHHEHAARHHREAAAHHEEGNHETAAHHAHTAQGHLHHPKRRSITSSITGTKQRRPALNFHRIGRIRGIGAGDGLNAISTLTPCANADCQWKRESRNARCWRSRA